MTLKRKSKHVLQIALLLVLFGCTRSVSPVDKFEKSRPRSVKAFYVYPSTIRMLGQIMGSSNMDSFEQIDKARLFIDWKEDDKNSRDQFLMVKSDAEKNGYDELMSVKSKESNVSVLKTDGQPPVYLVFSLGDDADYLLELEGEISFQTLREMGSLDLNSMTDIIDLEKPSEKENPKAK